MYYYSRHIGLKSRNLRYFSYNNMLDSVASLMI
nr:MAG TPA: hypothetical protein [Caudoviricetes sp.]